MRHSTLTSNELNLIAELPSSPSAEKNLGVHVLNALTGELHVTECDSAVLSPRQVLRQTGLAVNVDSEVYLLDRRGKFESIDLDRQINLSTSKYKLVLSAPGMSVQFQFEDQSFENNCRYISGLELAKLVGKNLDQIEIWAEWHSGKPRLRVIAETLVDLLDEDLRRFCSLKPKHSKLTVFVNGRRNSVTRGKICYADLVGIAFGEITVGTLTLYTVTFLSGPPEASEGSLIEGQCVSVIEGMIFNVTQTDKS